MKKLKRMSIIATAIVGMAVIATASRANIIATADDPYPVGAPVFTLDPEPLGVAARNLAADRQLRQTFQNPSTFDVRQIVLSLGIEAGGVNGGLDVEIFEVADVNDFAWNPGALVHSFSIPTSETLPQTAGDRRLALHLTGGDVFTLPQRDSGAEGYGIQLSNGDDSTNLGPWRHTNDGVDNYTAGAFYTESGSPSGGGIRDSGVAISDYSPIPEPSTTLLAVLASIAMTWISGRRR